LTTAPPISICALVIANVPCVTVADIVYTLGSEGETLQDKLIDGLTSVLTVISNGLCKPSQGTIYPALKELEAAKYVKGHWIKIKNRQRKVYHLTEKGRNALAVASEVLHKALAATGR